MTDLQSGIIGLGLLTVLVVFFYNQWQERRQGNIAKAIIRQQGDDVLLSKQPAVENARNEPIWNNQNPEDTEMAKPSELPPVSLLDSRFEWFACLSLVDEVPFSTIFAVVEETLLRIEKPVNWLGYGDSTAAWQQLLPECDGDIPIHQLCVTLPICDRKGPISEADVHAFRYAMDDLAERLMVVAHFAEGDIDERAAALDRFCASVDVEIAVNLVAKEGETFHAKAIESLAASADMLLSAEGGFLRHSPEGHALFRLDNLEAPAFLSENIRQIRTAGLTFSLDVPRVAAGEVVFRQMIDCARHFADTLGGTLVDDNRQPFHEEQIDHICREFIIKAQNSMMNFGLPAGSAKALRLFS